MNERVSVHVLASDPISHAGIVSQLRYRPELRLIEDPASDPVAVALVVVDQVDEHAVRVIRALQRDGIRRLLLVATRLTSGCVLQAVEAGCCGVVRRVDATPESLTTALTKVAAGDGSIPPDLLGKLLDQLSRLQRQTLTTLGLRPDGLAERETQVLKLIAEGRSTREVAVQMAYSERTIKNILRDVIVRLNVRNRVQAVAYAVREGWV